MQEKETNELEQELGSTHLTDYTGFIEKHAFRLDVLFHLCQDNHAGKGCISADLVFKGGYPGTLWI